MEQDNIFYKTVDDHLQQLHRRRRVGRSAAATCNNSWMGSPRQHKIKTYLCPSDNNQDGDLYTSGQYDPGNGTLQHRQRQRGRAATTPPTPARAERLTATLQRQRRRHRTTTPNNNVREPVPSGIAWSMGPNWRHAKIATLRTARRTPSCCRNPRWRTSPKTAAGVGRWASRGQHHRPAVGIGDCYRPETTAATGKRGRTATTSGSTSRTSRLQHAHRSRHGCVERLSELGQAQSPQPAHRRRERGLRRRASVRFIRDSISTLDRTGTSSSAATTASRRRTSTNACGRSVLTARSLSFWGAARLRAHRPFGLFAILLLIACRPPTDGGYAG